jgi:hypothetical protein
MKKNIFIPTLVLTIALMLTALNTSYVQADFEGNGFVQRIAERFGLDENDVDEFMGEMHEQRRQDMEIAREERLNQAVTDGVITEEQRQALEVKWAEQFAEHEQHREEMQAWFEKQGIDHEALMQYGGLGPKRSSSHGMGMMGR